MTNREIAQRLFVTMKTVETHLRHCYQKLEIVGRGELSAALGER
jgi:DNA-binding CsgD family transcriptional regulator